MMISIIALVPVLSAATLIESATNSIARRIARSDPAQGLCRFVGYPDGASSDRFDLNPDFWLKGVDFSCVSPWNSAGGSVRAGTAISKRHLVFARHFPLWKDVRIVFVGEDGGVCPTQIEAVKAVGKTDIKIGSLKYELTPNIKPAKILPMDFDRHIGRGVDMPVVTFTQNENAIPTQLGIMPTNGAPWKYCFSHSSKDPKWALFRKKIVGGDSGNPAFLLIGNEPILLYCLQNGGCGSGPALHMYGREIQQVMDELCPGYKLETFDFKSLEGKLK